VRVHEVIGKAGGSVVCCSLAGDRSARARRIPAWMLDTGACATMRGAPHPVAEPGALAALPRVCGL
jgi:hypothetical protein